MRSRYSLPENENLTVGVSEDGESIYSRIHAKANQEIPLTIKKSKMAPRVLLILEQRELFIPMPPIVELFVHFST